MSIPFIIWLILMVNYCLLDFWECVEKTPKLKSALWLSFITVTTYPIVIPGIHGYYAFLPFLTPIFIGIFAGMYVRTHK